MNKYGMNNGSGMFIDEYIERKNISTYCVVHAEVDDDIDLTECEDMFRKLKKQGIVCNNSFSDDIWICHYSLYETNMYLDFNIKDIPQEIILSMKKYLLVKLAIKKNEVITVKSSFNNIKDMLVRTDMLNLDCITDFKQYAKEKSDTLYLSSCREFLQFCTLQKAKDFYAGVKDFALGYNPKPRTIPDYNSILKYEYMIKDFIDTGSPDLRIKHYPILIWWMVSTIIPLRPSEFLLLKRDCIYKEKDKCYIHIERIKNKSDREKHVIPIMTEFQIPEYLYDFINDFIEYVDEIDSHYDKDASADCLYLVSNNFYKECIQKAGKRNSNKITLQKLRILFEMFEKDIIENIYHYEIVELGMAKKDNQIERIRFGDTRHLAFMNMMMQGLNPLYIQKIGGHYTLEEQLYYCNHLETYTTVKTYMLSKVLNNNSELYYSNCLNTADWGLKHTEKELLGTKFYQYPKVKNGAGRCMSVNVPADCKCDECLFCEHFIPEKDIAQTYLSELKQKNQQNIEIKKEVMKKLLKEQLKDEHEIETVSKNLASLINQSMILNAYTLNLKKGDGAT